MSILGVMFAIGASNQGSSAQSTTVVSPAGTANTEGNILFFPINSPYPDFPDNPPLADGWRAQELHPASAFGTLGTGPLTLTGLAWRPDLSVNEPISHEWQFDLNLATTDVGSLSMTFADNIGSEGVTNVFSGAVELQTDGVPRGGGLPNDFDYVVAFDKPYIYDPQQGDLLVEWRFTSPFTTDDFVWVDAEDTVGEFVFGLSADAAEAFSAGPGLFVTEFTVIPEPSTFVLASLALAGLLVARKSCRLLGTVCVITVVLALSQTSSAQLTTVSPAGAEDSDADLVVFPLGHPFPEVREPPSDSFRIQELHPTAFESLGSGPFLITSMAWRPDISVNGPVSKEWDILALNLTTTPIEPGEMSLTFADNYGPDGATTVFSGTVRFETDGVPTAGGLPHDFDYVFEFDTPYLYDPAEGNLLFEILGDPPDDDPWIWIDGASEGEFASAFSPDAEMAVNRAPLIVVTQFTFTAIPEPSTWLLGLLLCAGVAAYRIGRRIVHRPNFALCIAAILTCAAHAMAQSASIVAPAGLEYSEGNELVLVQEGAPENGFRAQYSYLASDFFELPDGHDTIISMAWRPDHTIDFLHTPALNLELRLSTTSVVPGSLSSTFAENVGSDETLVYSGPIAFHTDGSGPAEGPRPFDYLIEFREFFHYDPVQGNLLVDFSIRRPATGALFLDSEATALIQSVGETNASSPVATLTSNEAIPVQFTFIGDHEIQLADYNGNQMVEQADLDLVLLHWGEVLSNPADVGWINDLPTGAVDQEELDQVLLNWGDGVESLGPAGVPEPSSCLLCLVAMGTCVVVAARYMRPRISV